MKVSLPSLLPLLLLVAALLAAQTASAAALRWSGRPYTILASDKPLPDFLRELVASQGSTAVIDPKVNGSISGKFTGAALKTLDSVCATNGLVWYYDGAFVFIELATDAHSEVLSVANATHVAETLKRLDIADARYPLTVVDVGGRGSLHVAGPKRYLEMVKQTLKLLDANASSPDNAEFRLFPLKYAWAADFRITRSGKELVIPGVATVLRNLYGKGVGSAASRAASLPLRAGPTRQMKLQSGETVDVPKLELPTTARSDDGADAAAAANGNELPQFQTDTRLNAVIVRDMPERMDRYAKLIASMDSRPRLVEIEVTIMDISTDTLDSLGIDWRLHSRHGDLQIGRGDRGQLTFDSQNSEAGQVAGTSVTGAALTPLGMMFSASIGHDMRDYLLARVNALAQKGNANFIARPKVLTLDNNEAQLENLSEFFVRVNGFQDAGLFSVTTGTSVRVTPLIVDATPSAASAPQPQPAGVMMSIDIEDGDLSGSTVDQIPVVRRRRVNTQALMDEGQSLLIAGYTSEEKSSATSGVPLLSDIPVVGRLFKYDEKTQNNMERFYLLTPRLITSSSGAQAVQTLPVPASSQ
jgi:type III secretion protein C